MPDDAPMNPRTTTRDVCFYGHAGAEWIGADGARYRTSGKGRGMFRLLDAAPVPGMQDFTLGAAPATWDDDINDALNARDASGGADA